jgi:hypothetical protein
MLLSKDTDIEAWKWMADGAPMGLSEPILPGGHFPPSREKRTMDVETLDKLPRRAENHASYNERPEGDRPPAWNLLEEQVNSGFARLFKSKEAAEEYMGESVHPAPLGCVSKAKEDGTWKHRLIQDLRANHVNAAVQLPERQVLPRGVDHGRDMAKLAALRGNEEKVKTLILDFKDSFMSVPLSLGEQRFNCAHAEFDLKRTREALYDDEPKVGNFVVWRVLGFGGKPNPLIFSRVASIASRIITHLLAKRCCCLEHPLASKRAQDGTSDLRPLET